MDEKFISYELYLRMLCCADWIWDQSLLTVEINTITRWAVKDPVMLTESNVNPPRSIVTDHYLLDPDRAVKIKHAGLNSGSC